MIFELAIGAGVVLVAGALARAIAARRGRVAALPPPRVPKPRKNDDELDVGDVLLYLDDSLLLAGCIEIDEGARPLRLFATPQSQSATWVLDADERGASERGALFFMRESDAIPLGSLPDQLPLEGRVLHLSRRGRGVVRAEGEVPPQASSGEASYAMLTDVGGRAVLSVELPGDRRLALVGERVDRRLIQRLPGTPASGD